MGANVRCDLADRSVEYRRYHRSCTTTWQSPQRSPSVFNFFRPGYLPPNTPISSQGLVAPELQITNKSTVVGHANYMQTAIVPGVGKVPPNYTGEMTRATDAAALVERYALL